MTIVLINAVLAGMIGFALYRLAHVLDIGREMRADLRAFAAYVANRSPAVPVAPGPVFKTLQSRLAGRDPAAVLHQAAEIAIENHYGAMLARLKVEMRFFPFIGLSGSLIALNLALGDVSQSPDDPMQLLTAIPVAMQSSIAACLCVVMLLAAQIHLEQRLRRLSLLIVQSFVNVPAPRTPPHRPQPNRPPRDTKEARHADA